MAKFKPSGEWLTSLWTLNLEDSFGPSSWHPFFFLVLAQRSCRDPKITHHKIHTDTKHKSLFSFTTTQNKVEINQTVRITEKKCNILNSLNEALTQKLGTEFYDFEYDELMTVFSSRKSLGLGVLIISCTVSFYSFRQVNNMKSLTLNICINCDA